MTRKSGIYLRATYGTLDSYFDLIRSHHQCTLWSPQLEIEPTTTVCRSRNSTTGPLWPNVSWRYVYLTEDTTTSGATSSKGGVTSPQNISLMSRIYIQIIFKWRNWCYLNITMTRKSSKHLHATYGGLNRCFDLIRSHQ